VIAGIALPNAPSVALHERLGFRKIGQFDEIGRKFGHWVNVGYWQRML
jgi:phosphinothricin acetyltransferase